MVTGDSVGELSPRALAAPLTAGEPLLPSLLRPPDVQTTPDLFAVELDQARAVLGRIDPCGRVDVYATDVI